MWHGATRASNAFAQGSLTWPQTWKPTGCKVINIWGCSNTDKSGETLWGAETILLVQTLVTVHVPDVNCRKGWHMKFCPTELYASRGTANSWCSLGGRCRPPPWLVQLYSNWVTLERKKDGLPEVPGCLWGDLPPPETNSPNGLKIHHTSPPKRLGSVVMI